MCDDPCAATNYPAVIVGVSVSLFICWISSMFMIGPSKWIPKLLARIAIFRLIRATKASVLARGVKCSTLWFGVYDIDPKHLVVVVVVDTDAEKEKLKQDAALLNALRENLAKAKYPLAGRAGVGFVIESNESVRRDFDGNWYYRFK